MSSFKFRINYVKPSSGGDLVDITVFAGKDETHRQASGTLQLRIKEFEDLERVCAYGEAETGGITIDFDRKKLDEWLEDHPSPVKEPHEYDPPHYWAMDCYDDVAHKEIGKARAAKAVRVAPEASEAGEPNCRQCVVYRGCDWYREGNAECRNEHEFTAFQPRGEEGSKT